MKDACELDVKDKKIVLVNKCEHCNSKSEFELPKDDVEFFRKCGVSDSNIPRIYKKYKLDNCYFYGFCTFRCRLCGEGRVLAWEAGNSPASHEVISPSKEIRFWPGYDYPIHKIRICKWCLPDNDSKESRDSFLKKMFVAMQKVEDENWDWRSKHKTP